MTLTLFEGPAGSGKTTRLFSAVEEYLLTQPLQADQRVLAVTKMHGSRRRMLVALTGVPSECCTLNSFALGLVRRRRSLALTGLDVIPADSDFAGLAAAAADLLTREAVVRWVAATHPALVVDELQDLRGPELAVVRGLSRGLHVLCAADEFQDLAAQTNCEAVDWARSAGNVVTLDHVHRTSVPALLAAAGAVRRGTSPGQGAGFKLFSAPQAPVAAGLMARNLKWASGSQVVVLSPTGPDSSPFVRDAIARLSQKPFTDKKTGEVFGPYTVPWESSTTNELASWEQALALDGSGSVVTAAEILAKGDQLPGPLLDWVQSRIRLTGVATFSAQQLQEQLRRAQALVRAHAGPRRLARSGLTVHQAKNREFDRVIVLWPVHVGGTAEVQRRLLYNAITRAKHHCVVIVQDPSQTRLASAPFG